MKTLPKTMAVVRVKNPNWVAVRDETGLATNMDDFMISIEAEVEVLTVHFNSGTMRVRYDGRAYDVPAKEFIAQLLGNQ